MKVERKLYISVVLVIALFILGFSSPAPNVVLTPNNVNIKTYIECSNGNVYTATGSNLQPAIWSLNGTGGTVWIPPGLYTTTNLTIENGANIIGCGSNPTNCTIRFTESPGITIRGSGEGGYNGVRISNLCIQEYPSATPKDIGLQILGIRGNGALIDNVLVGVGTGNGYGFEVANIDIFKSRYVTLLDVTSRNCTGYGLRLRGVVGDRSNCVALINCHIASNNQSNIHISDAYDCTIIGGTVQYSTTEDGIWVTNNADGLSVIGTVVEGNNRYGIHLDSVDGCSIKVSTTSQGERGIKVDGTSSYNTFHIDGFDTVANTVYLNSSTHNNTVFQTICPVTNLGTDNLIFKLENFSIYPIYYQANPPTIADNSTAYWYNTTSTYFYQIFNLYGTQRYANCSDTTY